MKQPFPPRRLAAQNELDGEAELIRAEVSLFQTMSERSGLPAAVCRQIFLDELGKLPKRPHCHETEADRLFIASGEQMLKQCPPKRVFSFKVLGMFILAFALAVCCAYLGLNGE
jgi:hypothetical protein